MMKVDLSFVYLFREMSHNGFLMAETDGEFVRGELTSDYLAYFGFTSGLLDSINGNTMPEYIQGTTAISLIDEKDHDEDTDVENVRVTALAKLLVILDALHSKGYTIPRRIITQLVTYIVMYKASVPVGTTITDSVNQIVRSAPNFIKSCGAAILDSKNRISFHLMLDSDVVGTGLLKKLEFAYAPSIVQTSDLLNFDKATQVGGDGRAFRASINRLTSYKFCSNFDANHIKQFAERTRKIYPPIVI